MRENFTKVLKVSNMFFRLALAIIWMLPVFSSYGMKGVPATPVWHRLPITISGKVRDVKGQPLPGVNVTVRGTSLGTTTNNEGNYNLSKVDENATLEFSYIGYRTQQAVVNKRSVINITLIENPSVLDEVIVTGYTTTARKDLTGAVGTVNITDLQKAPVASFEEALAGRVAGVQVSSQSGRPGSAIDIVIRGVGSISQSNRPLFVIDGFPMENPDNNVIDPDNIETINILKDASATALYGARGSNGVVVITTKRGTPGAAKINYNGYYGVNKPTKYLQLMTPYQFVQAQIELASITSTVNPYLLNGKTLDDYRDAKGVDFQDGLLRTGSQQNHSVNVSGGTNATQYSLSGNFFNQEGIIVNSAYRRYQVKSTLDQKIGKKFKVGANLAYTTSLIKGENPQTGNGNNSVFNRVFTYRPISSGGQDESLTTELYDPEISNTQALASYLANPVINQQNIIRNTTDANVYGNAYLDYNITPHLKFTTRGNLSSTFRRYESFNGSNTAGGGIWSPSGINGSTYHYRFDYYGNSNLLTYTNSFNSTHFVTAVVAAEIQTAETRSFGYVATQIPDESLGLSGLDAGTITVPTTDAISESTMASFLGSVSYNYKGKYYFTGNFRADGSSKFVGVNKWGYFPSGAVKWRFSKEKLFDKSKWLSEGNVRFSYGSTGNNRVGDFDTYARINFNSPLILNGVVQPLSAVISSLQNPLLRWEKTVSTNIGLDLGFLKDRINFTVDLYDRSTKDLLYNTPLPYNTGFTTAIKNIASISNRGVEFTLGAKIVENKSFSYSSSINTSLNRNRLTSLSEATESAILTAVGWEALYGSIPSFIAKVGGPLGQMYGLVSNGLYQYSDFDRLPNGTYTLKPNQPGSIYSSGSIVQPGDNKFVDINKDGMINDDDKVVIGNGYPLLYGGWSNNLQYKNFDVNLFFQWSYGNDIVNANRIWFSNGLGIATRYTFLPAQNAFEEYANRWTPANQNTDIPKMNRASQVVASQFIEDGSFIRLKTLNVGYTLPAKLLSRYKISKLRIYVAANNLFTLTHYKGYDPELSAYQTALTPGVDYSTYPRPLTVTAGLNLSL
jgi:TonB-linked SusC/RagA family outer membrane protein